ncbi:MAG: glycosyltransferase family 2 protein [Alphaproteobacteria bacterium]
MLHFDSMKVNSLSVFFPAFNEEKNIAATVVRADEVLKNLKLKNYEIIVVNDGSSDKTAEVVLKLAQKNSHIRLVNHQRNRGYGGALKTGFSQSKYEWVAFADSDGQFDFADIKKFLAEAENADLVLGFRIKRADSLFRQLTTFGWKTIARIFLGLDVKDYSCGFKLIKKQVYDAVLPLVGEEKVTQIEMLVKAKRLGFKFAEVGVPHYPRKFGTQTGANLKVVFKSIIDLFKLWWKIR